MVDRYAGRQSRFAVHFFGLTVALLSAALLAAEALIHYVGYARSGGSVRLPPALILSTACLAAGSWFLQSAWSDVRRERQRPFRKQLLWALAAGTAFVALQFFGLWCLLQNQSGEAESSGANAFVFVFAAMHVMHFTVALLFLVLVTLRAHADRYDHEYYWGVTVCACFWHFLGVVWLAILGVLMIAIAIL